MADTDLSENKLFQVFLSSDLYIRAAKDNLIVCVPVNGALELVKLDHQFLMTHVLQASPYFKQEYVTLTGKSAIIANGEIITSTGKTGPRTVSIVGEELYYDDNFTSFRVIIINLPFIGKVPLAYVTNMRNSKTMKGAETRLVHEHAKFMERHLLPKDLAYVHDTISKFVQNFNNNYVLVKALISMTGKKVSEVCTVIRQEVARRQSGLSTKLTPSQLGELQLALEAETLSLMSKKLFPSLCDLYAPEEKVIQHHLERMQKLTLEDLGVRAELTQVDCERSRRKLATLNTVQTPLEKLSVIHQMIQLLTQSVDLLSSSNSVNSPRNMQQQTGPVTLTADDIIPFTVYLVLRADVRYLFANMEYMKHFLLGADDNETTGFVPVDTAYMQVNQANFTGAVRFIMDYKVEASPVKKNIQHSTMRMPLSSSHLSSSSVRARPRRNTYSAAPDQRLYPTTKPDLGPRTVSQTKPRSNIRDNGPSYISEEGYEAKRSMPSSSRSMKAQTSKPSGGEHSRRYSAFVQSSMVPASHNRRASNAPRSIAIDEEPNQSNASKEEGFGDFLKNLQNNQNQVISGNINSFQL